jgi:hypothetical protein
MCTACVLCGSVTHWRILAHTVSVEVVIAAGKLLPSRRKCLHLLSTIQSHPIPSHPLLFISHPHGKLGLVKWPMLAVHFFSRVPSTRKFQRQAFCQFSSYSTELHVTLSERHMSSPHTREYPKVSGLSRNEINNKKHSRSSTKIMTAKLSRLTHKVAIQLHLAAESCTICSFRSRRPVPKLLDTPSYLYFFTLIIIAIQVKTVLVLNV